MAHYVPSPPIVRQNSKWTCWAAVIQSWARAVYDERVLQEDLLLQYKNAGLTKENGGIGIRAFPSLMEFFNLASDPPFRNQRMYSMGMINEARLAPLMGSDPVILMHLLASGESSHAVLIYGVDQDQLFYMDPMSSVYQSTKNAQLGSHGIILYRSSPMLVKSGWNWLITPR